MAPLFKRRPSSASLQQQAAAPDAFPASSSASGARDSAAPPARAASLAPSAKEKEPAITWGSRRSRPSSISTGSASASGTTSPAVPDSPASGRREEGVSTPVRRKPSFLKRLLHKDSPSRSPSGGSNGMTASSSSSSLASASRSPVARSGSRPPPAASASLSKATSGEEGATARPTSGYKMWRRERTESKKASFASLGHSADDSERDRRGDPDNDDDSDVDSAGAVVSAAPLAVKRSGNNIAVVVPSTTNTLTHGESLAPAKLLAIASDPAANASSAAAPAGSYVSSPTTVTPTTPLSASGLGRPDGINSHPRQMSTGESLWSLQASDEETSDDDLGFETPDEGLSEVGEEEEEEVVQPIASRSAVPAATSTVTPASAGAPKSVIDGPPPVAALPHAVDSSTAAAVAIPSPTTDHPLERTTTNPVPDAYRPSALIDQAAILDEDLQMCHRVMHLFLNSHIAEAENVVKDGDPKRERLYYQVADAILCTLKGIMTFEPADLKHAHNVTRYCTELSASLRKQQSGIGSRLSGLVKGTAGTVAFIKGMTKVERHAELIYAETLLLKAVLGIISGGEWMALVKEALNMRSAEGIYRTLNTFCEAVDKSHPSGFDDSVDMDFRSGIELGVGMSALMLSMMPGKVVRIAEVFGLQGSRPYALAKLAQPGGWDTNLPEPKVPADKEGVRRPVADMGLMVFHLVISSLIPVTHVDVPMGARILWWNLDRYPNGVFTLFFQSRLHVLQCQPHVANKVLDKAMVAQQDYVQLQLLSRWDLGINSLALCKFADSAACFEQLYHGSNWSKATYCYSTAAALLETDDCDKEVVEKFMKEVPKAIRKVVGKSIPIEKFVSRKSRKYLAQGRLAIPGVELSYIYGLLQRTPGWSLQQKTIPRIDKLLAELDESTPETYGSGEEYWDDFALAHMLRGVCYALLALPNHGTVISPDDPKQEPVDKESMTAAALGEFKLVQEHSRKIALDHFIPFYTRYEVGCTLERMGKYEEAVKEFEMVLHGKLPEVDTTKMTGKYSLHSGVTLKCSAAIQQIREKQAAGK